MGCCQSGEGSNNSGSPSQNDSAPLITRQEMHSDIASPRGGVGDRKTSFHTTKSSYYTNSAQTLPDIPVPSSRDTEEVDMTRRKVMAELIDTEKSYVDALNVLAVAFVEPLKRDLNVNTKDLQVFQDLEVIKKLNTDFYNELKKCSTEVQVCHLFRQRASSFRLYVNYINNYEQATQKLTSPELKPFLRQCSQKLKELELRQVEILSYLIQPVQRIPRYQLLLQEMLQNTHHTQKELKGFMEETIQQITNVAQFCNIKKSETQKIWRARELQNELKLDLIRPGRSYVMEGKVKQMKTKTYTSEKHLYLFTDLLILVSKSRKIVMPFPFVDDDNKLNITIEAQNDIVTVTTRQPAKAMQIIFSDKKLQDLWLNEIKKLLTVHHRESLQ